MKAKAKRLLLPNELDIKVEDVGDKKDKRNNANLNLFGHCNARSVEETEVLSIELKAKLPGKLV
jgi:hypothetical protein